jgi:hypothetical protein
VACGTFKEHQQSCHKLIWAYPNIHKLPEFGKDSKKKEKKENN